MVYGVILHLVTWTYPSDVTSLQSLNHQVNRIFQNIFKGYFRNSLEGLFNVS